jgi:hypothetical protein
MKVRGWRRKILDFGKFGKFGNFGKIGFYFLL